MIGIVVLAEKGLATGLLGAAVRTLGSQPPGLLAVAVDLANRLPATGGPRTATCKRFPVDQRISREAA